MYTFVDVLLWYFSICNFIYPLWKKLHHTVRELIANNFFVYLVVSRIVISSLTYMNTFLSSFTDFSEDNEIKRYI